MVFSLEPALHAALGEKALTGAQNSGRNINALPGNSALPADQEGSEVEHGLPIFFSRTVEIP
jgi:hypothetical protein